MPDTIEWLETIGRDAGLRHAPADELGRTLEEAGASASLAAAAMSGDRSRLAGEFGERPMKVPQATQSPCHEDEPEQDDEQRPPAPEPPPQQ